jgi:hypothetical protein
MKNDVKEIKQFVSNFEFIVDRLKLICDYQHYHWDKNDTIDFNLHGVVITWFVPWGTRSSDFKKKTIPWSYIFAEGDDFVSQGNAFAEKDALEEEEQYQQRERRKEELAEQEAKDKLHAITLRYPHLKAVL